MQPDVRRRAAYEKRRFRMSSDRGRCLFTPGQVRWYAVQQHEGARIARDIENLFGGRQRLDIINLRPARNDDEVRNARGSDSHIRILGWRVD